VRTRRHRHWHPRFALFRAGSHGDVIGITIQAESPVEAKQQFLTWYASIKEALTALSERFAILNKKIERKIEELAARRGRTRTGQEGAMIPFCTILCTTRARSSPIAVILPTQETLGQAGCSLSHTNHLDLSQKSFAHHTANKLFPSLPHSPPRTSKS
jgi:hypothetical protein